jgi:two-component system sensor histidine kinase VanS
MTKMHRKTSITKRLFLYIVAVVLGTSVIILLSNTLLLKPLYYSSIRGAMVGGIESLSRIDFSTDDETWQEELDTLAVGKSYDIIIARDDIVVYSSSVKAGFIPQTGSVNGQMAPETSPAPDAGQQNGSQPDGQVGDKQPRMNDQFLFWNPERGDWKSMGDDTYMATIKEPRTDIEMLVCTKDLGNDVKIALTQAIEPINQSVRQANILLIGCTLLSMVIAVIFVFKMSKLFTRPIRQIQNTVGELAVLNFGNQCDVRTGDELQSLGDDINRLGNELEQALNTLREQNIQLEKDIIAQRQFISNASHELRTPLSLIKGYADEMNTGYAKNAEQRDYYIEIIAEEAAKMNRLLREMLELSRMESGRIELIYENLSINERINNFIEKYDGFIAENGLKLTLKLEGNPTGFFDAMRFEQVLANYISNAARYGDEKKLVRISTQIMEGVICVSVFNSGNPISEDYLTSIWDGFFKADEARTRVKDSYGLGLSVVKAIQNVAGQKYGVENVDGGVCFWFDVQRTAGT